MKKLTLSTAMLVSLLVSAAAAQDSGEDDVIVVTADRRTSTLIEVPQAVSVLSADDLKRSGVTQLRDLVGAVPGLNISSQGAGQNQVTLRGVTTGGTNVAATVSTYIDDVPYGSSTPFGRNSRFVSDGALFNVSRIEILRGPQGTLYGASSMGGLMKYVTIEPDPSGFFGSASAAVSSTKEGGLSYRASGAVNLPVAENAALRVSGFYTHDGGYIDNVANFQEDVNQADLGGVRADFLIEPTEELSVRLVAEAQRIERDGTNSIDFVDGMPGVPVAGELSQSRPASEAFDQDFLLFSGTIDYDFGPFTVTSISSYQETDTETAYDQSSQFLPLLAGAGLTYGAFGVSDTPEMEKFTQEVRFASSGENFIDWIVGGFYTKEDGKRLSVAVVEDTSGAPAPNFVEAFGLPLAILDAPSTYEEWAVFGDVTINFTDRFDVTGGIRYANIDQSYDQTISGLLFIPYTGFFPADSSEDVTTYLANARYSFSDHSTAYFRFATGYRPGGPNFVVLPSTPPTFDADSLKSYELGYRVETDDRAYSLDTAVYYIDWSEMQIFDTTNPLGGFANATGGANIYGVEIAAVAKPIDGLNLTGSFAYQDASLSQAEPSLSGAEGDTIPNVPEFSAAFNADYAFNFRSLSPTIGASLRYVSEREGSFSLNPEQYDVPAYTIIDLRAGLQIGLIDAQFFVHNLADERGQISGGVGSASIIQPRTIGVRTSLDF